ncbi:hypothetical protein [Modestobacter sp. VKM Ac-2984]|uniref:hypothetical protein n=1 Tax=Modestobacter sp. VKM Ac-2984 TaxID=3004138 RepID=UPI0022AAB5CC|nr:hypothetical protein [Modestobacter sp. VKM Ac-2984]MCZ2814919.1 hypothetical protein [Modestobacter sp. VKM Ac-2984]
MASINLHTSRPSVYLDQWVWIDMAKAVAGKPRRPDDPKVLAALRDAAAAGVAFPLSPVHYFETFKIKDPAQRHNLARVMASVSYFRTLRGGRQLMRHQMLNAMHETFERPAFRPTPPEPLGLGAAFAFTGKQGLMTVRDATTGAKTTEKQLPGVGALQRKCAQLGETLLIAGPADDEVATLRKNGYMPEATEAMAASRLAWEELYVSLLRDRQRTSATEMRVQVMARELCHEHLDLFNEVLAEYRLPLERALGIDLQRPGSGRAKMMAFSDRIPSMRLAADMKAALFRNAQRTWELNDLYDIDALSLAIPYCHVVVTDADAADRVRRTKGDQRHDTAVFSTFGPLLERLPDLVARARAVGGDPTGWDVSGPGEGFVTTLPDGSWPSLQPTSAGAT